MGYRRRLSEWSGVLEGCSNGEIGLQVSYRPSKYVPSGICNVTLQAFRTAPSATSPQYEDGSCVLHGRRGEPLGTCGAKYSQATVDGVANCAGYGTYTPGINPDSNG